MNSAEQILQGKWSLQEWIPKLILSNILTKWQIKFIVDKCVVMHMGGKTHLVMVSELAINSKISFLSGFIGLSIILSIQQQSKTKKTKIPVRMGAITRKRLENKPESIAGQLGGSVVCPHFKHFIQFWYPTDLPLPFHKGMTQLGTSHLQVRWSHVRLRSTKRRCFFTELVLSCETLPVIVVEMGGAGWWILRAVRHIHGRDLCMFPVAVQGSELLVSHKHSRQLSLPVDDVSGTLPLAPRHRNLDLWMIPYNLSSLSVKPKFLQDSWAVWTQIISRNS